MVEGRELKWIVLSPHLDDGVFSCGGLLASAAARGEAALVLTFFTGDPVHVEPALAKFCQYEERKAEDRRATSALGAEHRWLPYVERAFRPPAIKGLAGSFAHPEAIDSFEYLPRLVAEITDLLVAHPRARLLAPLGVGNHIDHVELALAALQAMVDSGEYSRFAFYEDAYALGTRARKLHPVTRRLIWPASEAPQRAGLRALMMFGLLGRAISGPSVLDYLPAADSALAWRHETIPLSHEGKKLRAVGYYASQVELLGGAESWGEVMRRYHRFWGMAEPLWYAEPEQR